LVNFKVGEHKFPSEERKCKTSVRVKSTGVYVTKVQVLNQTCRGTKEETVQNTSKKKDEV